MQTETVDFAELPTTSTVQYDLYFISQQLTAMKLEKAVLVRKFRIGISFMFRVQKLWTHLTVWLA